MELVAPLPTELLGSVDPAARGAALLLNSATEDGDAPVTAAPFGLFLELLAARLPAGQELPVAGKALPAAPGLPAPAAPTTALPAPLLLSEGAVAGPRLDGAASPASPSPWPLPPPTAAAAPMMLTLPLATSEIPATSAAPPTATLEAPLASPVASVDPSAAVLGTDAPIVDKAPDLAAPPARRDTLATMPEQRLPAPLVDARAATALPPETRAAPPPAEVAAPVLRIVQRDGSHFTLRPVVAAADAAGTTPADWLPAATGQPATHATAPHTTAAPVQTSLDLSTPDWHEAFANRVQWLVDTKVGEAHIKLNPPELGAVDVKISLIDDQTFVQLTAATASARDELSQGLPKLRELLIASGLDVGGASVHGGRDGRHDAGGYAQQPTARPDRDVLELDRYDDLPAAARRRTAGRIDVFA